MTKDSLIQKMQGFQKNYTEEVDPEFYVVEKCIDIIRQHEAEQARLLVEGYMKKLTQSSPK